MKHQDRSRTIRLIKEVGSMEKWDKDNMKEWLKNWETMPEAVVEVLEAKWKSHKAGNFGVI